LKAVVIEIIYRAVKIFNWADAPNSGRVSVALDGRPCGLVEFEVKTDGRRMHVRQVSYSFEVKKV